MWLWSTHCKYKHGSDWKRKEILENCSENKQKYSGVHISLNQSLLLRKLKIQLPRIEQWTLKYHQDSSLRTSALCSRCTPRFLLSYYSLLLKVTVSYWKTILLIIKLQCGQCGQRKTNEIVLKCFFNENLV